VAGYRSQGYPTNFFRFFYLIQNRRKEHYKEYTKPREPKVESYIRKMPYIIIDED
jgi:hypothetical protein